ncbi:hypothetical protein [Ochrobactrum quorumnocens]|uniref:hypothetical protein n=1 Tax=Ochrobactrum quorumnocens TaxID=271865 RepID=UPI003B9EEBC7
MLSAAAQRHDAAQRGRYTIQNWQKIIEQIDAAIRQSQKTLPKGETQNERLQFLSEVAKEFTHFKDGWRNYVSHNKGTYNDAQAQSVMEHVVSS